ILLNSLALPEAVIKTALAWLEHGEIKRLDWYGHEGNPSQLLADKQWPQRLLPLLSTGKLQMRVPSIHTLGDYQNWLEYSGENLAVQNPKLNIKNKVEIKERDYSELKFHLTGMAGNGNKGHIWLLHLMQELLNRENQTNKEMTSKLRKVKLHFIGLEIDKNASLARELRYWGRAIMGENFNWTSHGNHQDTIRSMAMANIAVSCSKTETFSMVALEAMYLGNLLLRNRTGGWEEQLMDGINGFDLGETEQKPAKKQIELVHRLRNTLITPSNKLTAMSIAAKKHSQIFENIKYANWLLN
ncbi:MAG: glycosyltransferase, partial [Chitinophagia bacterium]|nr:glycosyltransferase [Chitinophagia bacterium]